MKGIVWMVQLLGALVGMMITRDFMGTFLRKRKVPLREIAVWSCHVVLNWYIFGLGFAEEAAVLMMQWIIVSFLLYEGSPVKRLFTVLLYFISTVGMEHLLIALIGQVADDTLHYGMSAWGISKIWAIVILQIAKVLRENTGDEKKGREYLVACMMINAIDVFVIFNLFLLSGKAEGEMVRLLLSSSVVVLVLLDVTCMMLYGYLKEKEEIVERKRLVQEQQIMLLDVQHKEAEETWKELKKFRHDYANHLICIQEQLKKDRNEEALEYVMSLLGNFKGEYGTKKISNSFIDTFLSHKIREGNQEGIRYQTDIVIPKELPFDEVDLCIIMGNALDNAAEAVRKIGEEERMIRLSLGYKKHALKLAVENSYNGEIRKDWRGRLLTTKKDSHSHGIGIYSMEKTIQKYNGLLDISYTQEVFRMKALLYEPEE